MNCPDLRRVDAHLSQGTRPTDKMVKVTSVKRYLCKDTISKDGLLVVRHSEIFFYQKRVHCRSPKRFARNYYFFAFTFQSPFSYTIMEAISETFLCPECRCMCFFRMYCMFTMSVFENNPLGITQTVQFHTSNNPL